MRTRGGAREERGARELNFFEGKHDARQTLLDLDRRMNDRPIGFEPRPESSRRSGHDEKSAEEAAEGGAEGGREEGGC